MKKRFGVTDPVPCGDAYYKVFDRYSDVMPNFAVAAISERMPNAREEAYALAERLNKESSGS